MDTDRTADPTAGFDPSVPLPGPPEPWATTTLPVRRVGPPYHMTDMIAAEPALARRLLGTLGDRSGPAARLAEAVAATAGSGRPIVLTGCGTSEHAALGGADLLRDALAQAGPAQARGEVTAVQAFELSLRPPTNGLVVGVTHEGATWATNRALEASRAAGARTAVVTVSERSPAAGLADPGLVVTTGELDQSWCHTVGYLSPLLALAAVGGQLTGAGRDAAAVAGLLAAGLGAVPSIEGLAGRLRQAERIVVVASGADRTAGRELVLKLEEGTWVPSAYRDLETMLHGHWPGTDASTALVLILADPDARDERVARARRLLTAAARIGVGAGAILAAGAAAALDGDLTPAGRVVVPEAPSLPPSAAALFGTATPLQLLTERLARERGTDPDQIRRDDAAYAEAAAAAED